MPCVIRRRHQRREEPPSRGRLSRDRAWLTGKDEMSVHGFRALVRTLLDEVLGYRIDYIEHQQARTVRDPLGTAYNRTTHLPERREMM